MFTDPDGYFDVVDWKTGRPKTERTPRRCRPARGLPAGLAPPQRCPVDRIRAAFHYVAHNRTVSHADLLGHDELIALIRSVPEGAAL